MKIVENGGFKIDLHIHSVHSKGKDGDKVDFNTIENLNILANKLDYNGVQICSITDHDAFGYDIYRKLKAYEIDTNHSLVKVLPGIEFSVSFRCEQKYSLVHVIAIFNDIDDTKIQRIESCLLSDKGIVDYDRHEAFSEERFLSILRKIDLDTILIAHQKNSPMSHRAQKCDANSVGDEMFREFIYTDYFEAFEFRNRKNEIFNKAYIFSNKIEDNMRFITGSDCHDWNIYPFETLNESEIFQYTFVKCLPTFRGLVMAITDYRRIKTINSFFNPCAKYIPEIKLTIKSTKYSIPLSRGINVIIGENSIGKSLLLHKLTNYYKKRDKLLTQKVISGYNSYLKSNGIAIESTIDESDLFCFDMQGEVRSKFEEETINTVDFLKMFYPAPINSTSYRVMVENELNRVFSYMEEKFRLDALEQSLGRFKIMSDHNVAESLSFIGSISRDNVTVGKYGLLIDDLKTIYEKINELNINPLLVTEDRKWFESIQKHLTELIHQYSNIKIKYEHENTRISIYQEVLKHFKHSYQVNISDRQKAYSTYSETISRAADLVTELIIGRSMNKQYTPCLPETEIKMASNTIYEYNFNSRLQITCISSMYIMDLFNRVLKKDSKFLLSTISAENLASMMPYFEESPSKALTEFKQRIKDKLDEDFKVKMTIIQKGMDKTQELSSGLNAQIYFDLLSYETDNKGLYIIDQPEDNISQHAIREYLLDRFKTMGEHRQVIIVTHNPQYIVNLDVDNVIYLGKVDDGFEIASGALEYKDEKCDMLQIVADHVEGGLDTLKRRWKRYEKNNRI